MSTSDKYYKMSTSDKYLLQNVKKLDYIMSKIKIFINIFVSLKQKFFAQKA